MKTKLLLLFLLAITLCSCDKDKGYDTIELNVTNYTFPKEGGDLKVYATNKDEIAPVISDPKAEKTGKSPSFMIKGEWYTVRYTSVGDTTYIHVGPNNTGEERVLPISFASFACWCPRVTYKQSQ